MSCHVMSCRPLACTIYVKRLTFSSKCVCLVKQQQTLSCSDTLFLKLYSQEANLVRVAALISFDPLCVKG